MGITHEDITELKKVFDDRYVRIEDCNETQANINKKFANDDKRIDRILILQENNSKALQKNNWLTISILGVIISVVITMVLKSIGVF